MELGYSNHTAIWNNLPSFHSSNTFYNSCSNSLIVVSITIIITTSIISLIPLTLLILKQKGYFWCRCDICQTYVNSNWTKKHENLCDWYASLLTSSPTKTIHLHVLNAVFTANPENIEYVLKTRFDNYPKGKPFSTILADFLGQGIFNVDGDMWKFQRKMASLELDKQSIRLYAFEIFINEIQTRLLPLLASKVVLDDHDGNNYISNKKKKKESSSCRSDHVLDLQDVFRRLTFDNICQFSFGLDPECLQLSMPISDFALSFDLASNLSAKRAMSVSPWIWKIKRILNLGDEKKLQKAVKMINVLAHEVIRQRKNQKMMITTTPVEVDSEKNRSNLKTNPTHHGPPHNQNTKTHKDLLSRFMEKVQDETYLRDIVVSFLLAGRDSVASALTSFFWLMANHPGVEESILDEADRVLGPPNSSTLQIISSEKLKDLHYLHAAIYESMRLYPPIQFDSKYCQNDDVLPDGTFVKKGMRVTYYPYAMGRNEEIWGPDCLEFKPERWLNKENGMFVQVVSPFQYPVFQAGVRVCLGKEMALVEIKTVIICLMREFRIELVETASSNSSSSTTTTTRMTIPKFSPGLTATFRGGLPVSVHKRKR